MGETEKVKKVSRVKSYPVQCSVCGKLLGNYGQRWYHKSQTGHVEVTPVTGGNNAAAQKSEAGHQGTTAGAADTLVAFIFGGFNAQIESYSQSSGVPASVLAGRVGELLRRKARGSVLGPFN